VVAGQPDHVVVARHHPQRLVAYQAYHKNLAGRSTPFRSGHKTVIL
jgi:hypothetical protein